MTKRNNEKQIWLDGEFKDRLEQLQAKKRITTGKKVSLSELSREMIRAQNWEKLEQEILELDKNNSKNILRMNIKFDKSFGDLQ